MSSNNLVQNTLKSYFSLVEIIERIIKVTYINQVIKCGFYSREKAKLTANIKALQPSQFVSVHKMLSRFSEVIKKRLDQVEGEQKVAQRLDDQACSCRVQ